jgi:hypothetical protein
MKNVDAKDTAGRGLPRFCYHGLDDRALMVLDLIAREDNGKHDAHTYSKGKTESHALQRYAERGPDTDSDCQTVTHAFCSVGCNLLPLLTSPLLRR